MHCTRGEFDEARGNCGESCPLAALDPQRLKVVTDWLLSPPLPLDASDAPERPTTTDQNLGLKCLFKITRGACAIPEVPDNIVPSDN